VKGLNAVLRRVERLERDADREAAAGEDWLRAFYRWLPYEERRGERDWIIPYMLQRLRLINPPWSERYCGDLRCLWTDRWHAVRHEEFMKRLPPGSAGLLLDVWTPRSDPEQERLRVAMVGEMRAALEAPGSKAPELVRLLPKADGSPGEWAPSSPDRVYQHQPPRWSRYWEWQDEQYP
jgi:hypothetical protein